jgi:hypothetical protein
MLFERIELHLLFARFSFSRKMKLQPSALCADVAHIRSTFGGLKTTEDNLFERGNPNFHTKFGPTLAKECLNGLIAESNVADLEGTGDWISETERF